MTASDWPPMVVRKHFGTQLPHGQLSLWPAAADFRNNTTPCRIYPKVRVRVGSLPTPHIGPWSSDSSISDSYCAHFWTTIKLQMYKWTLMPSTKYLTCRSWAHRTSRACDPSVLHRQTLAPTPSPPHSSMVVHLDRLPTLVDLLVLHSIYGPVSYLFSGSRQTLFTSRQLLQFLHHSMKKMDLSYKVWWLDLASHRPSWALPHMIP